MRILITGGNGQIAWDIIREAEALQHTWLAPDVETLDITDEKAVHKIFQRFKPDVVMNTAAYTNVDRAESEATLAFSVNCEGAKNVAMACGNLQIPLLHLSTDYVFDGKADIPYQEYDATSPINVYGKSKMEGEQAVINHCLRHIILRVSGVFGFHGHNFVKTILRLAKEKKQLSIVADQITCPTPSAAIAKTLLRLAAGLNTSTPWGVYHYCSEEPVNWHSFATAILNIANTTNRSFLTDVKAITTQEYPTPAKRPAYTVLNCTKLLNAFGISRPSWQTGIQEVVHALSTT